MLSLSDSLAKFKKIYFAVMLFSMTDKISANAISERAHAFIKVLIWITVKSNSMT
jgi:hypothetical protein